MIATIDRAIFLKQVDIFSTVRTSELLRIAELCSEVAFRSGETLFSEGDPGDSIYFILDGRVEMLHGNRPVMTFLEKGPVGALAVLTGTPRHFTAVAKADTHALRISALDFEDLLSENARIAREMIRALAARHVALLK